MPKPGWMYHPLAGKQLYPDLTPQFQRQLEGEGWVDSPDKLRDGFKPQPAETTLPPQQAAPTMNIRDVGIPEFLSPAPVSILTSTEARNRMAQIIDADGDRVDAALSVEELASLLDHMSSDEVQAVADQVGLDLNVTFAEGSASAARSNLFDFLRPELGVPVDEQEPADPGAGEGNSGGAQWSQEEVDSAIKFGQKIKDEVFIETLTGEVTLSMFLGTTETERVRWLENDATKVEIARFLDERGVTYKARDSKDTLAHQLLASLTNEA